MTSFKIFFSFSILKLIKNVFSRFFFKKKIKKLKNMSKNFLGKQIRKKNLIVNRTNNRNPSSFKEEEKTTNHFHLKI